MKLHLEHIMSGKWLLVITVAMGCGDQGQPEARAQSQRSPDGGITARISATDTNIPATPTIVHKIQVTSPVEYFRELLAMKPEQREKALSVEAPEKRAVLNAKIAEYQAMSPEERELRLRMTQLRWYLVPVMKSSLVERKRLLERIPEEDRVLIERRLKLWDEIPVQVQKDFLENEAHLSYLMKWRGTTAEQRAKLLETFPPARRQNLEKELAKWNSLPEEQREEMTARFNQFFDLDEKEKSKIIASLPASDRLHMEQALKSLESLPAEQRKQCIDAFHKFAQMSSEERNQFLRNAERWQSMSSSERQAWRALVQKVQTPPMPPPPLPPGTHRGSPLPSVAKTNAPR